jgi:hypothetical protein
LRKAFVTKNNMDDAEPYALKKGEWLDALLEPFSTQEDVDKLIARVTELQSEKQKKVIG